MAKLKKARGAPKPCRAFFKLSNEYRGFSKSNGGGCTFESWPNGLAVFFQAGRLAASNKA